jgi:hypothetical protein
MIRIFVMTDLSMDFVLEALEVLVALADRFADATLPGSLAHLDDRL